MTLASKTKTILVTTFAAALLTLSGCDLSSQCEAGPGNWCEALGGPSGIKAEPGVGQPQGSKGPNGRAQAEPKQTRGGKGGGQPKCMLKC